MKTLRKLFKSVYIGNNGYDRDMAISARQQNRVEMVTFGRFFIPNRDLFTRLKLDVPLNKLDSDTLNMAVEQKIILITLFLAISAPEN